MGRTPLPSNSKEQVEWSCHVWGTMSPVELKRKVIELGCSSHHSLSSGLRITESLPVVEKPYYLIIWLISLKKNTFKTKVLKD